MIFLQYTNRLQFHFGQFSVARNLILNGGAIRPIGLLLSIWANISETVHAVTNVCMKYIYEVIYDLSVDLVTFDLGLPLKVKSRSQTIQGAVSH